VTNAATTRLREWTVSPSRYYDDRLTNPFLSTHTTDDTETTTVTTPKTTLTTAAKIILSLPALCLAGLLLAPAAGAQCGDVNADNNVTAADAQRVLRAAVGQPVDLICEGECSALEPRLAALEALLANVTIVGDNLVLTGMNFQVVSGTGDTDGDVNGTGNIIIGYDEDNDSSDEKSGSHNLVVGRFHSYSNYGGIVAGEDNEITGQSSAVLGGARNSTDGDGGVVVGGLENQADADTSVVLAGENNRANGRSCSISGGGGNLCTGLASSVSGGSDNFVSGAGSVIGGGSNRTLGSNLGWLAGSFGPVF